MSATRVLQEHKARRDLERENIELREQLRGLLRPPGGSVDGALTTADVSRRPTADHDAHSVPSHSRKPKRESHGGDVEIHAAVTKRRDDGHDGRDSRDSRDGGGVDHGHVNMHRYLVENAAGDSEPRLPPWITRLSDEDVTAAERFQTSAGADVLRRLGEHDGNGGVMSVGHDYRRGGGAADLAPSRVRDSLGGVTHATAHQAAAYDDRAHPRDHRGRSDAVGASTHEHDARSIAQTTDSPSFVRPVSAHLFPEVFEATATGGTGSEQQLPRREYGDVIAKEWVGAGPRAATVTPSVHRPRAGAPSSSTSEWSGPPAAGSAGVVGTAVGTASRGRTESLLHSTMSAFASGRTPQSGTGTAATRAHTGLRRGDDDHEHSVSTSRAWTDASVSVADSTSWGARRGASASASETPVSVGHGVGGSLGRLRQWRDAESDTRHAGSDSASVTSKDGSGRGSRSRSVSAVELLLNDSDVPAVSRPRGVS
jgi:hypothetical protein